MRFAVLVMCLFACGKESATDCKVTCSQDADCPSGQTCGALGRCSGGEQCECTAGELLGCADEDSALFCNADGVGFASQSCNTFGCNASAGRCNECDANALTCRDSVVEACDADGLVASTEVCAHSCVDAAAGSPAHCAHIRPAFIPDVCDEPATTDLAFDGGTLDTGAAATCTRVITQASGPEICVVRHRRISIAQGKTMRAFGRRAIALVADEALDVAGTIDVSAGAGGAPGAVTSSGAGAINGAGGGGAGFRRAGANGGSVSGDGNGGIGGAARDPIAAGVFAGGGTTAPACSGVICPDIVEPSRGEGGGALMLVACRGKVTVTGAILASGGGGGGGKDVDPTAGQSSFYGGSGGGSGGYVVLQGIDVVVTGAVRANGGGGGAGCANDGCVGNPGQHGDAGGAGGLPSAGNAGKGGSGGHGDVAPTIGTSHPVTGGGGGGSAGRLQVYTPAGRVPTLTPQSFEPNLTVQTL
jgi:hypothetical protein